VPAVLPDPDAPLPPVVSSESPHETVDENSRSAAAGTKRYEFEFIVVFSPVAAWRYWKHHGVRHRRDLTSCLGDSREGRVLVTQAIAAERRRRCSLTPRSRDNRHRRTGLLARSPARSANNTVRPEHVWGQSILGMPDMLSTIVSKQHAALLARPSRGGAAKVVVDADDPCTSACSRLRPSATSLAGSGGTKPTKVGRDAVRIRRKDAAITGEAGRRPGCPVSPA
jgi:hypothetical protein